MSRTKVTHTKLTRTKLTRTRVKNTRKRGGAALDEASSAGFNEASGGDFQASLLRKIRTDLKDVNAALTEDNINFLITTNQDTKKVHQDLYHTLISYRQEYERKEYLPHTEYSTVNWIFKYFNGREGAKFKYMPDTARKIYKFTVREPPEDVLPGMTQQERLDVFKCMMKNMYTRATKLDEFVRQPIPIQDKFTTYRGVKGSNINLLMDGGTGLSVPIPYLMSVSYDLNSAKRFTDEQKIIFKINFEGTIPGKCISLDGEGEILVGRGVVLRHIKSFRPDEDGYTIHEYNYEKIMEPKDVIIQNIDECTQAALDAVYKGENYNTEESESQMDRYLSYEVIEELKSCLDNIRTQKAPSKGASE